MLQTDIIRSAIPNLIKTLDLPALGKKHQGKVRDFYILQDKRIIITTDRISAFDRVLGYIPYKGSVLNFLAAFWFEKTKKIVPNHVLLVPDPNVTVAKNCKLIPIEMIVRGYLTGVTVTSPWGNYQKGERLIYGVRFPDGLRKNQKLPSPVITPTYHGDMSGKGEHDTRLTKELIVSQKLAPKKVYEQMEEAAKALFQLGTLMCEKQGVILVDTKYEFGLYNGELTLIDEVHTPDSSRFWIEKSYEDRYTHGLEPENFDKEFLRLWYSNRGYKGEGRPPKMTYELIVALAKRYIAVYEIITGKKFIAYDYPISKRIEYNLRKTKIL